jgi:hypothetical protein
MLYMQLVAVMCSFPSVLLLQFRQSKPFQHLHQHLHQHLRPQLLPGR